MQMRPSSIRVDLVIQGGASRPALKYEEADRADFAAGSAEMDFGSSPAVVASLHEALLERNLGYLEASLIRDVAHACVSWTGGAWRWDADRDWVRLVPDAAGAITAAQKLFARPGSTLIYSSPLYPRLWRDAASIGMEPIAVPLLVEAGRYQLDLAGFERALRSATNPIVMLCNPHNPTGHVAQRQELKELSALVHRWGGIVISDEVHAPLTFSLAQHIPYASVSDDARLHSITILSTSKGWNTSGLKCSQVIMANDVHRDLWDRSLEVKMLMNSTSRLGAVAARAAYQDRSTWRTEVIAILESNATRLEEWVRISKTMTMVPPQASFLAWVEFDEARNAASLFPADAFRAAGVHVQAGAIFDPGDFRHIRMNFALPEDRFGLLLNAAEGLCSRDGLWHLNKRAHLGVSS
ncbi:hypothetical protein C5C00_01615 [Rathayibacter rathayi]|uniref:aminotransferase class I/II-fold pyridoxal phosphate-dependent enzyme n=1 Tax=Rathayibacter rathayi TaxID=33887 RepID=UPI000CE93044|nr:aminotransferase class I/II-fold pyridoxal phosphate-dependent enzyme [Rathayibacter rathayi]PPG90700.1 hypothetical protein C5C47_00890 [Rathayibacter rathayi]PPG98746.1 hypothetical protein C5C00_01615 [Rathayibacter rathayi]